MPWIALDTAPTELRDLRLAGAKQILLDGLSGLFVETLLMLPPVPAGRELAGAGRSLRHSFGYPATLLLLTASGRGYRHSAVAFRRAARRLRLRNGGFLMYIQPQHAISDSRVFDSRKSISGRAARPAYRPDLAGVGATYFLVGMASFRVIAGAAQKWCCRCTAPTPRKRLALKRSAAIYSE